VLNHRVSPPVPFHLLPPHIQAAIAARAQRVNGPSGPPGGGTAPGGMAGLGNFGIAGSPEPWSLPPYAQRLPLVARAGQLGQAGAAPELLPAGPDAANLQAADPVGPANPWAGTPLEDLPLLEALKLASRQLVWIQHPSPIDSKPLLGTREQYTETAVIAPPTDIASAGATAGAQALADGYSSSSGEVTAVLTPANAADFETIFQFTVPPGRAFLVWSVAGECHDYLGMANVIKFRVRVGTTLIVPETQLGLIGAPSNQLVVQEMAYENQTVFFEGRNLDGESGTLVTAYLLGWSFPLKGTGLDWGDLSSSGSSTWGEREGPEAMDPGEPVRIPLSQAAPGNPRYGGLPVWTHPLNGEAVWAPVQGIPGLSDPRWAGYRMTWTGTMFVVDQHSQPLPGFDLATMTIYG